MTRHLQWSMSRTNSQDRIKARLPPMHRRAGHRPVACAPRGSRMCQAILDTTPEAAALPEGSNPPGGLSSLALHAGFGVRQGAAAHDSQVTGQAELLPVLIAAHTWSERLRGRPCVVFLDNDSARHGLVSGYSPLAESAALIAAALSQFSCLGAYAWFGRVPSCSNVADAPSRLDFGPLSSWPGSQWMTRLTAESPARRSWQRPSHE